jgi:hypothetical protein
MGAYDQAVAAAQRTLALATAYGDVVLQALVKIGRCEQARAELSTAIDLYRSMDMTFWLPQTEAALAQVEGR